MAKERYVTGGLVLRAADSKEADKILTVLTADRGKLTVIAKGARSRRSRIAAACQLLAYSEMTLSESHGWQYLVEASTAVLFDPLRRDVELLALASYFAELAEAAVYEDLPAPEILSLLLNALYALGDLGRDPALVKAAFELRLAAAAGFAPLTEPCGYCGALPPENPALDIANGEVCCGACCRDALPLGADGLAALTYILGCDARRLYSFTLGAEALERLGRAAERYAAVHLEKECRTLDFYKSLRTAL